MYDPSETESGYAHMRTGSAADTDDGSGADFLLNGERCYAFKVETGDEPVHRAEEACCG